MIIIWSQVTTMPFLAMEDKKSLCPNQHPLIFLSHSQRPFLEFWVFKAIRKKERKKCLSLLYTPAASHHLLNPKTIPVISIPPLCCCPTPSFQTFKLKYPQMSSKVYFVWVVKEDHTVRELSLPPLLMLLCLKLLFCGLVGFASSMPSWRLAWLDLNLTHLSQVYIYLNTHYCLIMGFTYLLLFLGL